MLFNNNEIEKLTQRSLKSFHKQIKKIPSTKLRFIFSKKQAELDYAIQSNQLNKFDSNQVSYLNNMQEHIVPRMYATDLKKEFIDATLIPEMTFTEKQKKQLLTNYNI